MKPKYHRLRNPKHRPVFLLPYIDFDGQYAGHTDCERLSLGWAQYGPPTSASLKTFRYVRGKWSRQSEEVPLHRAVDLTLLLAKAVGGIRQSRLKAISLPVGTFKNQVHEVPLEPLCGDDRESQAFATLIGDPEVRSRLKKLRDVLNGLQNL